MQLIIACEALKGEVTALQHLLPAEVIWIEQYLHDYPDKLRQVLQEQIDLAEMRLPAGSRVLLLFGNCGGALDGLRSKTLELAYPDVADCIPMIFGSKEKLNQLKQAQPGTFFFNKSWIDYQRGPLGSSAFYVERYGEEKGWRIIKKMYKHYTHFLLIDNGSYNLDGYREHVKEACRCFDKSYAEAKGSLEYLKAILNNKTSLRVIKPWSQEGE